MDNRHSEAAVITVDDFHDCDISYWENMKKEAAEEWGWVVDLQFMSKLSVLQGRNHVKRRKLL